MRTPRPTPATVSITPATKGGGILWLTKDKYPDVQDLTDAQDLTKFPKEEFKSLMHATKEITDRSNDEHPVVSTKDLEGFAKILSIVHGLAKLANNGSIHEKLKLYNEVAIPTIKEYIQKNIDDLQKELDQNENDGLCFLFDEEKNEVVKMVSFDEEALKDVEKECDNSSSKTLSLFALGFTNTATDLHQSKFSLFAYPIGKNKIKIGNSSPRLEFEGSSSGLNSAALHFSGEDKESVEFSQGISFNDDSQVAMITLYDTKNAKRIQQSSRGHVDVYPEIIEAISNPEFPSNKFSSIHLSAAGHQQGVRYSA